MSMWKVCYAQKTQWQKGRNVRTNASSCAAKSAENTGT